ncbi:TerB family tellurite resistance protein [Streptomyces sp. VRA16 Mangrove soil]|uniref:TerB family tellurite resistance protein n=1 Tax=Streptomyces sp. VRA16 Mangrove soil TaxID=2817434 RepID=UPI001A9D6927|nr:TerB family tellurite resistance protein [Streptomyces sp. VRA16 Mangrove soil]MBO1336938.1 TerB family tellurite resistance protein [Streptomyces sp. VRA16 Mangrove soil]
MLPDRGRMRRAGISRVLGMHTTWTTVGDGEFFCPGCGGDRNYQRRTGRRRLVVLGVPVLPRGETGPVVQCAACEGRFGTEALDHPTTHRFSGMLRDAVHTVVLAVLAVGGAPSREALECAVGVLRGAGFEDCTEVQLGALVEALVTDAGRLPEHAGAGAGASLAIELHEALDPLAAHLAPAGRESILLQGARIALADGPYSAGERDVLGTVGAALTMCTDEVGQLLVAAARAPR